MTPIATPPRPRVSSLATLQVGGMRCAGCVAAVERKLQHQTGVHSACVNLLLGRAVIAHDPEQTSSDILAQSLTDLGFPSQVLPSATPPSVPEQETTSPWTWAIPIGLLILAFLGHGHHGLAGPWFHDVRSQGIFATVALVGPGRSLLVDGWRSFWAGHANMNSLVGLGLLSAYTMSLFASIDPALGWPQFFDEPVMLLGFILLGRALESHARSRTVTAIASLLQRQPQTLRLLSDGPQGGEIDLPLLEVLPGQKIKVRSGEVFGVDGRVLTGHSAADESFLTGEAQPVEKTEGDRIFAGTVNLWGSLVIEVERTGTESSLGQVIAAVTQAQDRKAPVQRLADRIAGMFAYGVMALAITTGAVWLAIAQGGSWGDPWWWSSQRAIAVLVVACPCALGLATPTAIAVGTGLGAKAGLLFKGGESLEKCRHLDRLVFDKTGTLTLGCMTVADLLPQPGVTPEELLQWAASVEQGSNHPIAQALIAAAQAADLPLLPGDQWHSFPGQGVQGIIAGERVALGTALWFNLTSPQGIAPGKTVIHCQRGETRLGAIALQDQPRPEAIAVMQTLKQQGYQLAILSGDRQNTVEHFAQPLGIATAIGDLSPQAKAQQIAQWQAQGETVAMVGDGFNDAPALVQADFGIALQRGRDLATETADLVILHPHLGNVITGIQLGQRTVGKIQQNLFWALAYNSMAIPIAMGIGLPWHITLTPAIAAACMAGSSLLVISNALLLSRYPITPSSPN